MTKQKKETTQITIITPKPARPPSMWMNLFSLIVLFALIVGARQLSQRLQTNTPAPEEAEKQIVMEDLENEKPMAESEEVLSEQPASGVKEVPPSEKISPALAKQATTGVKMEEETVDRGPWTVDHKAKKKNKIALFKKPKAPKSKRSPFAEPDPFTNGGTQDLDRPENQEKQAVRRAATKSTAKASAPVGLDERDRFIPFESE